LWEIGRFIGLLRESIFVEERIEMTVDLTIRIDDELYSQLIREAKAAGASPADLAAQTLAARYEISKAPLGNETVDSQSARDRFERHFGAVDLGDPTGVENEGIDEDLAKEYSDSHEET